MTAPATNPAPTPPQPHPPRYPHPRRHCTVSTLAGTAFLIASPFANGVADATVASEDVPATHTIAATSLVKRLAILVSPPGVALRRIILCTGGGSMCDPSGWEAAKAAIFVRTMEGARGRPEQAD